MVWAKCIFYTRTDHIRVYILVSIMCMRLRIGAYRCGSQLAFVRRHWLSVLRYSCTSQIRIMLYNCVTYEQNCNECMAHLGKALMELPKAQYTPIL